MEKSYGFAVGSLRAKENTLLRQADFSVLLGAKDSEHFAELLREKMGGTLERKSVPEMLAEKERNLWEYIKDIAPDMDIFSPFLYENDFHNLKVIIKSQIKGIDGSALLCEPATVSAQVIKQAIEEKKFDYLPDFLRNAAIRAYTVLSESGDAQGSDCIIDAECIKARMSAAERSGNKTVISLIRTDSFYKNIKVALRCAIALKRAEFLDEVLTENGVVSVADLKAAALSGEEKVLELLSSKTQLGGKAAAKAYKKSPSEFEKFCDNAFLSCAKECKYITIGAEPLIGYMVAILNEIKNLRIIYSGIKTGQPRDKIGERLRDIYG